MLKRVIILLKNLICGKNKKRYIDVKNANLMTCYFSANTFRKRYKDGMSMFKNKTYNESDVIMPIYLGMISSFSCELFLKFLIGVAKMELLLPIKDCENEPTIQILKEHCFGRLIKEIDEVERQNKKLGMGERIKVRLVRETGWGQKFDRIVKEIGGTFSTKRYIFDSRNSVEKILLCKIEILMDVLFAISKEKKERYNFCGNDGENNPTSVETII